MSIKTVQEILDFWFSLDVKDKWFQSDETLDKEIKKLFATTYEKAKREKEEMFGDSPEAMLALIILLDQFPRNMFRGKKKAYATDEMALQLASYAVKKKYDKKLNDDQRKFLYMPFMHSEDIRDQRSCVALFSRVKDKQSTEYALRHKEIILRFSRFPHRNEILGRKSTEREIKFLQEPDSSF